MDDLVSIDKLILRILPVSELNTCMICLKCCVRCSSAAEEFGIVEESSILP
jgi:hypothetical protein